MSIAQLARVARLYQRHYGTRYAATYLKASRLPCAFAVLLLTKRPPNP